ncbi:MAG: OmpA family protein [Rudaea sp.]
MPVPVVPKIPATPGLVVTAAKTGDVFRGKPIDVDIIAAITAVDVVAQHLAVHFSYFDQHNDAAPLFERLYVRQNLLEDLRTAQREGDVYYSGPDPRATANAGGPLVVTAADMPQNSPGMTYQITSARVLDKLKTRGKSLFILLSSQADEMQPMNIVSTDFYERVGTSDEMLPVLVNGKAAMLPAVHARGHSPYNGHESTVDMWFLDDPENVLQLKSIVRYPDDPVPAVNQVVRIDYPIGDAQATTVLAQSLAEGACRAELHGVYFNTASANLLPESDPTLRQVAAVLKQHKDWTLAVEGHTDAQGADDYNVDLSKRRAAAVRDALLKRFDIGATQLTVAGYGKTHPVDSNDTLIGRSHNRRVELTRACANP